METKTETMWAIAAKFGTKKKGKYFLYCGTWLTRKQAIKYHSEDRQQTWSERYKQGDRAVKVQVKFTIPH